MRTIRASELGSFLYCRRAWWYKQQGEPSENTAALAAGTARHAGHARGVRSATLLKLLAAILLLIGLVFVFLGVL
jgi:hypothetical protein